MHADPQDVVVTLTPAQAEHLARALRLQLALRWESAGLGTVPCREEIQRARALLDHYADQLERLHWGTPAGDVRVSWRADWLGDLVEELEQGAEESFTEPRSSSRRDMLATARALAGALQPREGSSPVLVAS
jgi:hypothetical protein